MLVTLKNREALLVVVIPPEEVVIVAGGVVQGRELVALHAGNGVGREFLTQVLYIVPIGGESHLLSGRESVQTHILQHTRARSIVECIGH